MRRIENPKKPYKSEDIEWLGEPPAARLHVHEEQAKEILAENRSPDLPFRYSLNPYRGCLHGCAYCYARPTHQYLGFGAGTDFERELVVKVNAPSLLRKRFEGRAWQGEPIMFSGNTDCYQPLEAAYRLTRACLEVCRDFKNPVTVVTKGALIQRDLELLCELDRVAQVYVAISIPFADATVAKHIEPHASSVDKRFGALKALSEAGLRTAIFIAPVIPGLNDSDIPVLLQRARDAGASRVGRVALRLPAEAGPVFEARLREARPNAADKILSAIRQVRNGRLYDPRFGARMRGEGPRWEAVERLFEVHKRRLGFDADWEDTEPPKTFERPDNQLRLFD